MDLSRITTLEQLKAEVEAFEGCPLKAGATRTVFSDGSPDASIVVIGEAPGAQEDAVGKPFVGRSGQLLDKLMLEVGFDRRSEGVNSLYITNSVFWRPPDNRTPTPAEILSCRPLLMKHLALKKPKLIVLVGGTAVKSVLQSKEPMNSLRQRWLDFDVPGLGIVPTLATFHPAYLLRNPPAKKDALEDLAILRAKAEELGIVPPKAAAA